MNNNFKDGLFIFIILIILSIFSFTRSYAQHVLGDFKEKNHQCKVIQLNQVHRYHLELKKGEFASLTLDQMGIDLVITISDPNGRKVEAFDSPSGNNGAEMILIDGKINGDYKLDIRPLGEKKKPTSGRYLLSLNGITTSVSEHIDTVLSSLCQRNEIPGFGVSILSEARVLFQKGYGYADLSYRTPYTIETIQGLASISKLLLAISLLQLVEAGKLSLDSPINSILPFDVINPFFPNIPITIRQLSQHSSSINYTKYYAKTYLLSKEVKIDKKEFHKQDYRDYKIALSNERMEMPAYLQKVFNTDGKWYEKDNFIKSKPGTTYQYSNENSALAAYIIEIVSGQSYADYTREHILMPLGLRHTGWELENDDDITCSIKYGINKNPCPPTSGILYPDGGLFSNIKELSIFLQEMMNGIKGKGELLEQESYESIIASHKWPNGKQSGIFCELTNDAKWGHNGGDIGMLNAMFVNPKTQTATMLLTNRSFDDGNATEEFKSIWQVLNRYGYLLNIQNAQ